MTSVVDIEKALSKLRMLEGRTPDTHDDIVAASFATLASYDDGGVFTGSFLGRSAWERHNKGDELVHILKGETELTIIDNSDPKIFNLKSGMIIVVPKGKWHRFNSEKGVTVLTVTPQPTDHSKDDYPLD